MDAHAFLTLFSGVALLAAKPGPGMMTVATKAMGDGIAAVVYFMVGTNLVKILFFTLVALGYGLLPEKALIVSLLLKAAAAAYLIVMGVQGLKKPDPETNPNDRILRIPGFMENFTAGFLLTLSNPFDILFFAGILPTILDATHITMTVYEYALCCVVIVAADALVALSYAVPISLTRRFFIKPVLRKLNIVSSAGLIVVGIYMGYTALV